MPIYSVQGPDGRIYDVEGPAGASEDQIIAAVKQQIAAGGVEKPASGILGALGKGAESAVSSIRAGIKGVYAPEEAAREGRAREEDIQRRYAEQVSLDKVKQAYEQRGLLSAAGEAISQVPAALAEQAPNIAATLASARVGAMAGAPFGVPGAIVGGLTGAVVPSFFQQAGGNIQRQAAEGQPISRAAAYGAAAPQAALDVASTFIPLGRSLAGKALGPGVAKLLEKGAEESAERLAKETLLKTVAKGTAVGALAEIPTEVAQQMLERAQAGLPLLNEDALNEYGETAYQVSLLAPIGAAGRVVERGQARDIMEQRAVSAQREQRQAERLAAAEQEEQQAAFKETDEYALQIGSQYDALQKQYDDLGAELKKKLPASAPIADREAFKGLKDQRAALKEQLQQLSAEYNRVRPRLMELRQQQKQQDAAAQQQALAEQQARMQEEQQAGPMQQLTLPGMEPQVLTEEAAAPAEEPVDYAAQANNLRNYLDELRTKAQTTKVLSDKLALGEEYTRIEKALKEAEDLAKQAPKPVGKQLELLRKKMEVAEAEGDIPAQVKLAQKLQDLGVTDLSQIGAQQTLDLGVPFMLPPGETKAQFGARVYKPGAEDIETQEREYLEQQRREEAQRLEDANLERRLLPETSALRRIAQREPVEIGEKDIYGPTADRIVESIIERQPPTFTGKIAVGEGLRIVDRGDSLRAQLAYARVTNNKERVEELRKRLDDLQEPEVETPGSAVELGAMAKKVGVEGTQTPAAMAANRVTRLSQSQLTAFDRLADFVNSVREREAPSSEARQNTIKGAAYRLRDIVVGLALNEADARLAQMSKPALTTEQQMRLVAGLERPLNELIQRGALALMPPVQQKAQMRGSRIVMGAQEKITGQRLFGSFPAAANTIRAQMRSIIDKTTGTKEPTAKGAPYKASVLRIQFPETAKERTDAQLFKQAYDNATEAETAQLERIEKALPNIENNTVRESIMDSVRDKADGKPLELDRRAAAAVESLRRAVTDEGAQAELFPGTSEKGVTRATPGRFQRFLDSREVAKMREQAAEAQKRADYMVKMAAAIEARIEKERKAADDYVNKLTEGKAKTPVEAAQRALQTAVDKNVEAAKLADDINKRRSEERTRIASMVAELDRAHKVAQKKVDDLAELMESASQFMLNEPKNTAAFAAAKSIDGQLRRAIKDFQAVVAAHTNATALYNKILEAQASDTIDNALIREGAKAQKRIDEARQALSDARQAEADAKRAVESIQKEQRTETEEQKRKRLFLYPSEGIKRIRVFRDTTVPSVADAVKAQRGIIAKAEADYETARLKGDERGMRAASIQVETAYRNLYRRLDEAPLRQAEFSTPDEIKAFEEYETAQRAFAQAELNASFAEKGLPTPQMPPRRNLGPVTRLVASRPSIKRQAPTAMRTGSEESRAGLTTKGMPLASRIDVVPTTVAAETRAAAAAPKSVLEQIAEKRAELRTVNEQLAYIDANKKGPVRAGKSTLSPKQAEAKRTAEARKRELLADLKELSEQQRGAAAEASLERKAQKELRKEAKKLARTKTEDLEVEPTTPLEVALKQNVEPMAVKSSLNRPDTKELLYKGKSWYDYVNVDDDISDVLLTLESIMSVRGYTDPVANLVDLKTKYARLARATDKQLEFVQQIRGSDLSVRNKAKETVGVSNKIVAVKAPAKATQDVVAPDEDTLEQSLQRIYGVGLSREAQVNGMTFAEAARVGAQRSSSPMVKLLFNRLAETFEKAPKDMPGVAGRVFVLDGVVRKKDAGWAGFFIPAQNIVMTAPESTRNHNKVLLHELTHAATVYGLTQSPELNNQVTELRERVIDWLDSKEGKAYFRKHRMELMARTAKDIYGLKNNKEFLAEVFADRGFQKLLTEIPSSKPKKSIFTRFVEALSKFFNLPEQAQQSAFAEAVALTEEILAVTEDQIYGNSKATKSFQDTIAPYATETIDPYVVPANLRDAIEVSNKVVSQNKGWWDGIRSNSVGTNKLAFETGGVDRFAPFEKLAKYMDRLKGTQMMYYLRMYDQRMNYAAVSAGNGALDLVEVERPDGEKEFLIESVKGPSLRNVVLILRDAKKLVGDVDAAGRLFTLYLAAKRAERVGFSKLDFSGQVTEQELKDAVRQIEATPELKEIFEDARDEYNAYNRNQVRFAEKAGVFSKEFADKLLSSNDYIPWYRERNGVIELTIGGETPFKLGNVKDSPHLDQLIGGDKPILDFMVSSVQNTNMLVDMSLRNLATRNAVFELTDIGGAIITPKSTTGPDVVKFKHKGEDRYAILTTERLKIGGKEINTDIPAELVVKGMEGIPLQVTGVMRAIGFPTKLLRKFVTLNPSQMIRQVFRDSSQAFIAAGSNDVPVLGALREIRGAAQETLTRRGITGGQVFTGTTEDISKVMRDITKGGVNVNRLIAGLESMAADIDAGTRASQYNSYINQGMSQMEATLLSLESMNFNKRGASPSVHAANNLYAFFNAQVQGLNVLYKAMFGQLTPAERANVKQKIITRGAMLFAASLAYAHLMQDDEAYKNASPADKYGNWFIRIPGFDEPVRIPIPFELGYIFKALPEALYNSLMAKAGTDEAKEAAIGILRNVIPGASAWFIPQALKPTAEVVSNYSFFLQRPLLSAKEQSLLPEYQYRDNTTELAKLFGGATGTSPIKFEALVSGYTGGLGLMLLGAASLPFVASDGPEKATKRLSDMPVIGDFFQPNDGSWVLNNTFDTLADARKTQRTFNELLNRGQKAEAKALLENRATDYARAELEGYFRHQMGELTKLETAIKASAKTPDEKRELLNQVKQARIKLSSMVRDASDKTKLQASLS